MSTPASEEPSAEGSTTDSGASVVEEKKSNAGTILVAVLMFAVLAMLAMAAYVLYSHYEKHKDDDKKGLSVSSLHDGFKYSLVFGYKTNNGSDCSSVDTWNDAMRSGKVLDPMIEKPVSSSVSSQTTKSGSKSTTTTTKNLNLSVRGDFNCARVLTFVSHKGQVSGLTKIDSSRNIAEDKDGFEYPLNKLVDGGYSNEGVALAAH